MRPVEVIAEEWSPPKDTSVIISPTLKSKREVISTGVRFSVIVPSPNWA